MLKGFRKPFHVPFMLKGVFQPPPSSMKGYLAANLSATDAILYIVRFFSKSIRGNFDVFVTQSEFPLAGKCVICLSQQQMLALNYVQTLLENKFLNSEAVWVMQ